MRIIKEAYESVKRVLKLTKEYNRISRSSEIVRRYIGLNLFDGILTTLGILFGGYVGRITQPGVIIATGLGAAVAMGVSGFWGAYESEKTERVRSLMELESATLSSLEGTEIQRAGNFAAWFIAITNSASPFMGGIIVISPFFFSSLLSIGQMYLVSMGLSFASLMILGAFFGKSSKRSMLRSGLEMVLVGVASAAIIVLFLSGVGGAW